MKILKHGKYQKKVVVTCPECECEFEAQYEECLQDVDNLYVWIDCPECGKSILLHTEDFQVRPFKKEN